MSYFSKEILTKFEKKKSKLKSDFFLQFYENGISALLDEGASNQKFSLKQIRNCKGF